MFWHTAVGQVGMRADRGERDQPSAAQLSSKGLNQGLTAWPPGSVSSNCSCLVCACVCAREWFILRQDIRVLRIHPLHQPRKVHAINCSILPVLPCQSVCVCVCEDGGANVLCTCPCVVKLHPCPWLCFSSFSPCLWHVDVLASCVVGVKLSLHWQGASDRPVARLELVPGGLSGDSALS